MALRITTILVIFLSSALSAFAEITIPMTPEGSDDSEKIYGNGHRSRPIANWCNIDIETQNITTSIQGIISYEIILGSDEVIISTPLATELCLTLASLQEGTYTLRIITPEHTYIGSLSTPFR